VRNLYLECESIFFFLSSRAHRLPLFSPQKELIMITFPTKVRSTSMSQVILILPLYTHRPVDHSVFRFPADRQCGPRILTFFLYLSDVEEGGGTDFPQLDLTIQPKRGRALLWPSVLDSDPMAKDGRMMHQALPVLKGVKFAANGWIHMYDYQTPQKSGCN
jgi:2OG-Fe(II) oxygenase superfamily